MTQPTLKRSNSNSRGKAKTRAAAQPPVGPDDLHRLEFFRNGLALMPALGDRYPAVAYVVAPEPGNAGHRSCTCRAYERRTCDHLKAFAKLAHLFEKPHVPDVYSVFKAGPWHRLSVIMADGDRQPPETVDFMTTGPGETNTLVVVDSEGTPMLYYPSRGGDRGRLIERCTGSEADAVVPTRADVLRQLANLTMTHDEEILHHKGLKTTRQTLEGKFWYRFAYHCFREFGTDGCILQPAIDPASGEFMLSGLDREGQTLFYLTVPRNKVKRVLTELKDALANPHGLQIEPLSLDSVFDVSLNEGLDLEIRPLLRLIQQNGEYRFFKREDLKKFQYGHLYYIKELGIMVEDQYPRQAPAFDAPVRTVIERSRVSGFLADHAADLQQELVMLDERVRRIRIMTGFDRVEIAPETLDRDWCWLSVIYRDGSGDGSQSVSLADIVSARQADQRFVATGNGWVDCHAPAFAPLQELADRLPAAARSDGLSGLRLSRADLFRIGALSGRPLTLGGDPDRARQLGDLLALKPLSPLPTLAAMTGTLRGYQQRGLAWLWFLHDNGFGGLLCDDMGLGKTHQIMAFLVGLRETQQLRDPFLVVCPTTVISHWERKLRVHAPGLTVAVHYGTERDLHQSLEGTDGILTSYGILRRDAAALAAVQFGVVVFDEVQHIKNAQTQSYLAAQRLTAGMKIGVTGTPIENRIDEIKSLMDLVVPDYLGSDDHFQRYFRLPIELEDNAARRMLLSRLIAPFTLRRLKKSVLQELPEKIEDLRTCRLSDDQVGLYRDAIDNRGRELRRALADEQTPLPYMHIFALLNLLKQICDHPALVEKDPAACTRYASGKWDLFCELLSECLDSGQKIVVYSQYLGMIDIIARHLEAQGIGFVSLTGVSRNRGRLIARFDQDPDCRVFMGSLKAGGVGIDLVAASVVIHYDRWWNAAREDQATDRVHRIGQRRGVQVFKLVTEGTLEEKIAAIIDRKKNLMESILHEDDPDLVKTFSRQELMEMLVLPTPNP